MKIQIEINETLTEDEILIKCCCISDKILEIQKTISDIANSAHKIMFYKGNTEYYIAVDNILFFFPCTPRSSPPNFMFCFSQNDNKTKQAKDDIYQVKYKLYELENILPGYFMRISKSAILNTKQIYSINRNLAASSIVTFTGTHKRVFVSRYYYKPLTSKLEEQRLH